MIFISKKVRIKTDKVILLTVFTTICNENMRFLSNKKQDQLQIPTNQCISIANMPIEGNENKKLVICYVVCMEFI